MIKPTFAFEKTPLWRLFIGAMRTMIFICASLCIAVMTIMVIMRYIFHLDFFGYEDIELTLILWVYYLGAAYATYTETHIKGDVLSYLFKSGKGMKFYHISITAFSVFVMSFWVKWGFQYVQWNFKMGGKSSALKIPLVIGQTALYVGILGLFFFAVINLVKYLKMKPEDYLAQEGGGADVV